jgi:hypothetical protein
MAISTTFTLKFVGAAVERGLARVQSAFKSLGGVAMRIGKSLISPFAGIAAAAGGLLAAGSLVRTGLELNEIGEQAFASEKRLQNATRSMGLFGNQADNVTKRLIDLSDEQARLTGIDDDAIRLTQSKLMTFKELAKTANVVGGAFDRATIAAIDMEKAGFGQAATNAVMLGKALGDPMNGLKALTRAGIIFTEKQKLQITTMQVLGRMGKAQNIVLKEIETQVGGAATATSTASARMKQSFSQLKEEFAKPFSIELGKIFDRIVAKIPELSSQAKSFGESVGRTMTQLVDAFEQGRLGEVVEVALMAGITRAGEEMIAAMVFAGNALYDTIAGRMKGSDLGKMMNIGEPLTEGSGVPKMAMLTPVGQIAFGMEKVMGLKRHFSENGGSVDTYQQTREGFRDALDSSRFVNNLSQTLQKQGQVPHAPGYRYAQPGEAATIMDGERVVRILDSIDQKLSYQP